MSGNTNDSSELRVPSSESGRNPTRNSELATRNAIVGLIGHPVGHSVSPVFQQAAFDALGLPWRYEAWETTAEDLRAVVATLREGERVGANVTVPHKEAVLGHLDVLTGAAQHTGAVNTIARRDGLLVGDNTDIRGFIEALREDGGYDPRGVSACVLGAGGAARAVIYALLQAGAEEVLLWNRTAERAHALAGALDAEGERLHVNDDCAVAAAEAALIVNCTTLGMARSALAAAAPLEQDEIPPDAFVMDIVANPLVTPLLARARARGCRTLGGLSMLVRQGAAAFELWTGQSAPLDVMLAAARRAMIR